MDMEARVPLRTGSFLDRAGLRRRLDDAVERWRARGYYEARADAAVEESATGDAVDVTITFVRGPKVTVSVRDNALTAKQLAELVPVAREGSVDEDLLEDSEARIEESLRAQGYRDADASYERLADGDQLRIVFTVKYGPLYRVAGVRFEGAAEVKPAELAALMKLVEGQPFVQARLDADRAHAARRVPAARVRRRVHPAGGRARAGRADLTRGPGRRDPADRRRAAHPRHGRGHGGQPRTVARRPGARAGHPSRRAAVRSGCRGRPRPHPRPVPQPGLPARARRRVRRRVGRPNGRARPVRDRRGAPGAGGPHPRGGQRAGRRSDDQARAAAQAGRAARPRGDRGEPAPAGRAGRVPPRHDLRAAARGRRPA